MLVSIMVTFHQKGQILPKRSTTKEVFKRLYNLSFDEAKWYNGTSGREHLNSVLFGCHGNKVIDFLTNAEIIETCNNSDRVREYGLICASALFRVVSKQDVHICLLGTCQDTLVAYKTIVKVQSPGYTLKFNYFRLSWYSTYKSRFAN